jgi:hypothetical protein
MHRREQQVFGMSEHRSTASKMSSRLAAVGIASAAALGGVVSTAAPASASTASCSSGWGVEVWEYANYTGACLMFTSNYQDTHGVTYWNGAQVYWTAGTAENNYPWGISLCYDSYGGGPCQGFSAGPYSANLQFAGVGSVYGI